MKGTFLIIFGLLTSTSFGLLYDQTLNRINQFVTSTFFLGPLSGSGTVNATVQTADDFTVPDGADWNITSISIDGYVGLSYQAGTFIDWTVQFWSSGICGADPCPNQLLYSRNTINEAGISASTAIFSFNPPLHFSSGHYWVSVYVWSTGTDRASNDVRWFTQLVNGVQPGYAFVSRDPKVVYTKPGINFRNTWAAYTNPVYNSGEFADGVGLSFQIDGLEFSITSGDITTAYLTSGDITTGSLTSERVTSGSLTTSPVQVTSAGLPDNIKSSSEDGGNRGSNSNAIIGGLVGGLFVVFLILGVIVIVVVLRKRKTHHHHEDHEMEDNNSVNTIKPSGGGVRNDTQSNYNSVPPLDNSANSSANANPVPPPLGKDYSLTKISAPSNYVSSFNAFEIEFKELSFENEIGKGSFGLVFKGTWRGGVVAIKRLIASRMTADDLDDLKREADTMCRLRPHVNVVQFLGLTLNPEICIVTEYMDGGSLYDFLHNEKNIVDLVMTTAIVKGIAAGMLHLHSEGIIHRDLAARNVLVGKGLQVKITDFGLSRTSGDVSARDRAKADTGPIKWMAPESLRKKVFNIKTDIWAYGITLFEVITRNVPYPDLDPLQVALINGGDKPIILQPPPTTPAIVAELMRRCLDLNPDMRPDFKVINMRLEYSRNDEWQPLNTQPAFGSRTPSVSPLPKSESIATTNSGYGQIPPSMGNSSSGSIERYTEYGAMPRINQ